MANATPKDPTAPTRLEASFKGGMGRKFGSADEEDRKHLKRVLETVLADQGFTWLPEDLQVTLVEYD